MSHYRHLSFFYPVDKSTDYPNYYQGLWDCMGDFPDELSFKRGDAIYILSKVRSGEPIFFSPNECFLEVMINPGLAETQL